MGSKHKIRKSDLKVFFSAAEIAMEGRYHDIYQNKLGWKRNKDSDKGNYHCPVSEAHIGGDDANPSCSVDGQNGRWHCFTCGNKGNLQSIWSRFLKGTKWGDSYTDFIVDVSDIDPMRFSENYNDPDFERNYQELKKLCENTIEDKSMEIGKPWIMDNEISEMAKKEATLPMEIVNEAVENLLNNKKAMDYLFQTRKITDKIICKYRIGLYKHVSKRKSDGKEFFKEKFLFPMINAEGSLVNIKLYDPLVKNPAFKWMYPYKGYDTCPSPIDNFTKHKIYFFEGEPDLYCALSFEYEGAVTMGAKGMNDVNRIFGKEKAKQLFSGKEIVICFDAEPDAFESAKQLADSMYPYVKQIKIIDLNVSDINPNGLNPDNTYVSEVNGKKKVKRKEKDFTDFMKKNGFDDKAKIAFDSLVDRTLVYTNNSDRLRKEVFKVNLQESRMARYFSPDRSKQLDLIASVGDFNCDAFMYPTEFMVTCRAMGENGKAIPACNTCMLKDKPGFRESNCMSFRLTRGEAVEDDEIEISDHNILGLIEVSDSQKNKIIKNHCGINERCSWCEIKDSKQEKLLHIKLANDLNEFKSDEKEKPKEGSSVGIDIDAYIQGDADIYPSRSYRFRAYQTTAWSGQQAVLFIDKAEPMETSIESFSMDQQTNDLLKIFKPRPDESIEEHLDRRYGVFSDAAGITGRKELFLINDLVFFSPVEIKNKIVPGVSRGWVEALIAGDTRTGKTMVSKFLNKHYKVGEMIAGSSSVSRSGLTGGVSYFNKKPQVSWGRIPRNDKGLVIIDEMGNIDPKILDDLTPARSEGIARIDKIIYEQTFARTRKIMLSNPRCDQEDDQKHHNYGIQMLRELCVKDPILSRFDLAFIVKSGDVNVNDFSSNYSEITTDFTEYQCRNLIMWTYSRSTNDVEFEDGFNDHVNNLQKKMLEKYHPSTQIVNQEMRAKLIRMSVSLASLLYSTVDDDWNKVHVKKEHADYIVKFLNVIYDHSNMKMNHYSAMKKKSESLGDMRFMMNISKYIDLNQLDMESQFTDKSIHQIFYEYLQKVSNKNLYMPSATSDKHLSCGMLVHEAVQKLIGILTSRNCLKRQRRGYTKTSMFNSWISERLKLGSKAEQSDILEVRSNKANNDILEEIE